jgi:hypothetical protein
MALSRDLGRVHRLSKSLPRRPQRRRHKRRRRRRRRRPTSALSALLLGAAIATDFGCLHSKPAPVPDAAEAAAADLPAPAFVEEAAANADWRALVLAVDRTLDTSVTVRGYVDSPHAGAHDFLRDVAGEWGRF